MTVDEKTAASAELWEQERSWPIWKVCISGEEVEYVARPGINEKDGVPQPWIDIARAEVLCRARTEDEAKSIALRDNPAYSKVESCEEVKS